MNNLTKAEIERLALLVEEAAEVQHIAMKILRHGYQSYNPFDDNQLTNKVLLSKEIGHLTYVISLMGRESDLYQNRVQEAIIEKTRSIQKYLHYNTAL